jgi:hypothetical protein
MTEFTIKKGDTSPSLEATLINPDGSPAALSLAEDVEFHLGSIEDGKIVTDDTSGNVSILNEEKGKVQYNWTDNDTEKTGVFEAEFVVNFSNGKEQTYPNNGFIKVYVRQDIESL